MDNFVEKVTHYFYDFDKKKNNNNNKEVISSD